MTSWKPPYQLSALHPMTDPMYATKMVSHLPSTKKPSFLLASIYHIYMDTMGYII